MVNPPKFVAAIPNPELPNKFGQQPPLQQDKRDQTVEIPKEQQVQASQSTGQSQIAQQFKVSQVENQNPDNNCDETFDASQLYCNESLPSYTCISPEKQDLSTQTTLNSQKLLLANQERQIKQEFHTNNLDFNYNQNNKICSPFQLQQSINNSQEYSIVLDHNDLNQNPNFGFIQLTANIAARCYDSNGQIKIEIDMQQFSKYYFKDVKEIRDKVDTVFSPQNIKMISKRAERHYPNGYCVYVLYCNRCQKRKPTYKCIKRYRKRSTECPFHMKFTKMGEELYSLTGGVFYHNHELSTPVLDPEILKELDNFNPITSKAATIRKFLNEKYKKEISYAQIAYEMNKRRQKMHSKKNGDHQKKSDQKEKEGGKIISDSRVIDKMKKSF